jgi:hypothetical protein
MNLLQPFYFSPPEAQSKEQSRLSFFGQNLYIRINFGDMNTLVIENKSYVVVPAENYQALQKKAALKSRPEKTLTIKEARTHSKKLIRKWASGK